MFSWKRGIAGACLWMVTSIAAFSALPAGAQSPDSTVTPMPTGEVTPKEPGGSPTPKLAIPLATPDRPRTDEPPPAMTDVPKPSPQPA